MAAELRFAPEAEDDLSESYTFYEGRAPGLGEEFLRAVDACVSQLRRWPDSQRRIFKNYRRAIIRRFPFVVIYEHDGGVVTVYAVFHTSQDPKKWRERLP